MIETERLLLRHWKPEDLDPFARMNADPRVMEHFPACLSRQESAGFIERIQHHFHHYGFGLFAMELRDSGVFTGYVGLAVPAFEAHFTPCIEIGWRLAAEHWGRGYATEAARAVVQYAFETLGFDELVSFTVPANQRSRRVMEKIGMRYDIDFDHPRLPNGHPLRRHVLYRLRRAQWADASR